MNKFLPNNFKELIFLLFQYTPAYRGQPLVLISICLQQLKHTLEVFKGSGMTRLWLVDQLFYSPKLCEEDIHQATEKMYRK